MSPNLSWQYSSVSSGRRHQVRTERSIDQSGPGGSPSIGGAGALGRGVVATSILRYRLVSDHIPSGMSNKN
jgi:hypothetical protein